MATALPAIADLTGAGVTEAGFKTQLANLLAAMRERGDPLGVFGAFQNLSLTFSVAASALTVAIKQRDGTNADATDVVAVPMRSATEANGDYNLRTISAALSMTVSSGSKLGHVDGRPGIIFVYLIDNSGTLELAVASRFYGWSGIVSTTAEGGAGAADAGDTMYSTTARSNVAFACIGYAISTQTTAGTWAVVPTAVRLAPFAMPSVMFKVHRNGTDQTGIATGGTGTTFDATTAEFDALGIFDLVNNYAVTPMAGVYEFYFQSARVNPSDGTFQQLVLRKDTTGSFVSVASALDVHAASSGSWLDITSASARIWLPAGAKVEARLVHSRGSNEDFEGDSTVSFFEGKWVGDIVS